MTVRVEELISYILHEPQWTKAQLREEIVSIIEEEVTKARIGELERLTKIDAFNDDYTLDQRPAKIVRIRLNELRDTK